MSIYEKEEVIRKFEFSVKDLYEDSLFLPEAVSNFYQLGEFFPELKETQEYEKVKKALDSLQNPIKGKILHKFYVRELNKYAGILIGKAKERVEEIKRLQRKHRKPVKVEKEIIPIRIPPSPWYKVREDVNKLSDGLWKDRIIIRNIIPIFEELINELEKLGATRFSENLRNYLEFFYSVEDGELTIPELEKLSPSYIPKDRQLKKLLTRIKSYSEREIKKEEERLR